MGMNCMTCKSVHAQALRDAPIPRWLPATNQMLRAGRDRPGCLAPRASKGMRPPPWNRHDLLAGRSPTVTVQTTATTAYERAANMRNLWR